MKHMMQVKMKDACDTCGGMTDAHSYLGHFTKRENMNRGHNVTAKLGTGARFAALEKKIARNPKVDNPAAVAAAIGRKKYGKKRFQKLAAAGRTHDS